MTTLVAATVLTLALGAGALMAQSLPVKIHNEIKSFRGGPNVVITETGNTRYSMFSGHKEAGRPWADIVIRKETEGRVTYLSRAYDCAAATYRVLGQSTKLTELSRNMTPGQAQDRVLEPGSLEFVFARYACGL